MGARRQVKDRVLNALRELAAGESFSLAELALRADTTEDSTRRACRLLVREGEPIVRSWEGYRLTLESHQLLREAGKLLQQAQTLTSKAYSLIALARRNS